MAALKLQKMIELPNEIVLNIYPYGSRVYGTASEKSDHDFIIVVSGKDERKYEVSNPIANATIYDEVAFQNQIDNHEISVLECLNLPPNIILQHKVDFDFTLNLAKLRSSISAKASNSWVKAKKKFVVEEDFDPYIAKKSLFHALRILLFGIQIAKQGKIYDFTQANYLWKEINAIDSVDWEVYKEKYQKIYNFLSTEFRIVAPKS